MNPTISRNITSQDFDNYPCTLLKIKHDERAPSISQERRRQVFTRLPHTGMTDLLRPCNVNCVTRGQRAVHKLATENLLAYELVTQQSKQRQYIRPCRHSQALTADVTFTCRVCGRLRTSVCKQSSMAGLLSSITMEYKGQCSQTRISGP